MWDAFLHLQPLFAGGSSSRSWRTSDDFFKPDHLCHASKPGIVTMSPAWFEQAHDVSMLLLIIYRSFIFYSRVLNIHSVLRQTWSRLPSIAIVLTGFAPMLNRPHCWAHYSGSFILHYSQWHVRQWWNLLPLMMRPTLSISGHQYSMDVRSWVTGRHQFIEITTPRRHGTIYCAQLAHITQQIWNSPMSD